ncbi:MAG: DUF4268 domain-containing protein [Phycisphaerales bacterium]|nr:DUF4268 domain-containing protein [Phycisphaerales bacterium]
MIPRPAQLGRAVSPVRATARVHPSRTPPVVAVYVEFVRTDGQKTCYRTTVLGEFQPVLGRFGTVSISFSPFWVGFERHFEARSASRAHWPGCVAKTRDNPSGAHVACDAQWPATRTCGRQRRPSVQREPATLLKLSSATGGLVHETGTGQCKVLEVDRRRIVQMPLYRIAQDRLAPIDTTTFAAAKIRERDDLQRLLRKQIEVILPDSMVLAEEFGNWEESRRSIDLLVLDRDANLVVVELKRTEDGGHMELQALRYAAMISAMTFQQAVDAHSQFLLKLGIKEDPQARILEFLGWEQPDEDAFGQDVRIVLASSNFSKELTTAVLWLNERGIDFCCVRMVPYGHNDQVLLDVQQVIPLPEAEEYQIRVREKATQERVARHGQGDRAQRNLRFWSRLLEKANAVLPLHQNISRSKDNWISATSHGIHFNYVTAHGNGRVELFLARPEQAENKAIFDELHAKRTDIEAAFGDTLDWQRLDDGVGSRVAFDITSGSVKDETTWDELHDAMVDAMKRLEAALSSHITAYRSGGKPADIQSAS